MSGRTKYTIYVTFESPEGVLIDIPFDILVNELCEYCSSYYDVKIDGTDNSIWNLFSGSDFIETLLDDDDFVKEIETAYKNSYYYDIDYDEWFSDLSESDEWEKN